MAARALAWSSPSRCGRAAPIATSRSHPAKQAFGNFIKIARDGRVTVAVPQVETGQGIWTALPQIVADELGAAWESVAVEPAPLTEHLCQSAGERRRLAQGHADHRRLDFGARVRAAAAPSRGRSASHAGRRRGRPLEHHPERVRTADGFVINGARTFTFGELAEEAADRHRR